MTNEQKIQHLYWRAGFGLTPKDLAKKSKLSINKAVKNLLIDAKKIQPVQAPSYQMPTLEEFKNMDKKTKRARRKELQKMVVNVNANWVRQMIGNESSPLQEKMTLFWHGHFACESKRFDFAANQINSIKQYALGNFRDLVVAVAKGAAMILYLNNQQNKKKKPNENFARELMELFTIGRGNYTEQDIKESARAFTGWFTNRLTGEFSPNKRQHDTESKTFMGKTGNFDGEDIIDIILERKETALYITTKIYRYFVNEKVNKEHIKKLSNSFYNSNYDIAALMQNIFESDWFYSKENVGNKIKSPIEYLVGMSKILGLKFKDDKSVIFTQKALGQVLFKPPNVAGWPGGKTWIDNSTLMLRLNLAALAFQKADLNITLKNQPEMMQNRKFNKLDLSGDLAPLKKAFQKTSDLKQDLADYILQIPVKTKGTFIEQFGNAAVSEEDKFKAYLLGIMSLPEYQMC